MMHHLRNEGSRTTFAALTPASPTEFVFDQSSFISFRSPVVFVTLTEEVQDSRSHQQDRSMNRSRRVRAVCLRHSENQYRCLASTMTIFFDSVQQTLYPKRAITKNPSPEALVSIGFTNPFLRGGSDSLCALNCFGSEGRLCCVPPPTARDGTALVRTPTHPRTSVPLPRPRGCGWTSSAIKRPTRSTTMMHRSCRLTGRCRTHGNGAASGRVCPQRTARETLPVTARTHPDLSREQAATPWGCRGGSSTTNRTHAAHDRMHRLEGEADANLARAAARTRSTRPESESRTHSRARQCDGVCTTRRARCVGRHWRGWHCRELPRAEAKGRSGHVCPLTGL